MKPRIRFQSDRSMFCDIRIEYERWPGEIFDAWAKANNSAYILVPNKDFLVAHRKEQEQRINWFAVATFIMFLFAAYHAFINN